MSGPYRGAPPPPGQYNAPPPPMQYAQQGPPSTMQSPQGAYAPPPPQQQHNTPPPQGQYNAPPPQTYQQHQPPPQQQQMHGQPQQYNTPSGQYPPPQTPTYQQQQPQGFHPPPPPHQQHPPPPPHQQHHQGAPPPPPPTNQHQPQYPHHHQQPISPSSHAPPPPTQQYQQPHQQQQQYMPQPHQPQQAATPPPQVTPATHQFTPAGPMPTSSSTSSFNNQQRPQPAHQGVPQVSPANGPSANSSIPHPTTIINIDNTAQVKYEFDTMARIPPPPSTTHYKTVDRGNAGPRFVRPTMSILPASEAMAKRVGIPLALTITPFAELNGDEDDVPRAFRPDNGPVRCRRCQAYINSFSRFGDGGSIWMCNFCDMQNEVTKDYYGGVDTYGKRLDIDDHPELAYGSVDWSAPAAYTHREPETPAYVFLVDVSAKASSSGVLKATLEAIRAALDYLDPHVGVGFVTFDSTVHFYDFSNPKEPSMVVVADINDMFVPVRDKLVLNLVDIRPGLEALMDQLPALFADKKEPRTAFGAALTGAGMVLKYCGGRLIAFHTGLTTIGPGVLRNRDNRRHYGTEHEKDLLKPASSFYPKLAKEMAQFQISVCTFSFATSYMDLASISALTSTTCGEMYYYPAFHAPTMGLKMAKDLQRFLCRPLAQDTMLAVRSSAGLRVGEYHGHIFKRSRDIELSCVDSERSLQVDLTYDDKLNTSTDSYVQVALLFTSESGRRRIRVHTLALSSSTNEADVFRGADVEAVAACLIRRAISQTTTKALPDIRNTLIQETVSVLAGYRKYCSPSSDPSELVLPEKLKLLPVLVMAGLKSPSLRTNAELLDADVRLFSNFALTGLSLPQFIRRLYPRLYRITGLDETVGKMGPAGFTVLPPVVPLSSEYLSSSEAFILDDGLALFVWLGLDLNESWLMNMFNIHSLDAIDCTKLVWKELGNDTSKQVHSVVKAIRHDAVFYPSVYIMKRGDPIEPRFHAALIEDRLSTQSYRDFLVHLHRKVSAKVKA